MAAGGKGSVRPRVEASAKWTAGGPAAAGDLVDWALRPGERIRHRYYTSMERQSRGENTDSIARLGQPCNTDPVPPGHLAFKAKIRLFTIKNFEN